MSRKRTYEEEQTADENAENVNMSFADLMPQGFDAANSLKAVLRTGNPSDVDKQHYRSNMEIFFKTAVDDAITHPDVLQDMLEIAQNQNPNALDFILPEEKSIPDQIVLDIVTTPLQVPDRHVRNTPVENTSMSIVTNKYMMEFRQQAFLVPYSYLQDPNGLANFGQVSMQVNTNILCAKILSTWRVFFMENSFYTRPDQLYPKSGIPQTAEDYLMHRQKTFCLVNREPQGLLQLVEEADDILAQEGGQVDAILCSKHLKYRVSYMDETNLSRATAGPRAIFNRANGTDFETYYGRRIIAAPFMENQIHGTPASNVFVTTVQNGSIIAFRPDAYRTVRPDLVRNSMFDIQACTWKKNGFETFSMLQAVRSCVWFMPLGEDCPRNTNDEYQGEVNRFHLNSLAKAVQANKGVDVRTQTDYNACPWNLDVLLKHNPAYAKNPTGKGSRWTPIAAVCELDEGSASDEHLLFIAKVLEARLWENITEAEKASYAAGLALMKKMNDEETAPDEHFVFDEITGQYWYTPNKYGGQQINDDFNGNQLGGFGTISGFLTLTNLPSGSRAMANRTFKDGPLVVMKNFLSVFSKLVKKVFTVTHKHVAVDESLLPAFNRHPDMDVQHKGLITLSNIIMGPFKVPSVRLRQGIATVSLPVEPRWTERIQNSPNLLKAMERIIAELKYFYGEQLTVGLVHQLINDTSIEVLRRAKTVIASNEASKKKKATQFIDKDLANELANILNAEDINPDNLYNLAKNITSKLLAADGSLTDLANDMKLIASTFTEYFKKAGSNYIEKLDISDVDAEMRAVPLSDLMKVTDVTPVGTKPDLIKDEDLNIRVTQLHHSVDSILGKGRFARAGIAVRDKENNKNQPEYQIDSERYNEDVRPVAFDEEDKKFFGGTIFTALPFVDLRYHAAPRGGFTYDSLEKSGFAAEYEISKERTIARYISGYPAIETAKGKRDKETPVIKSYEERSFTEEGYRIYRSMYTGNKLPRFIIHGLAYPYTGNPYSDEMSRIDRMWAMSWSLGDSLGFALRVLLTCDLSLQNINKFHANHIPFPVNVGYLRPSEEQDTESVPVASSKGLGKTYVRKEGIQQIVTGNAMLQQWRVERSYGFKPAILDKRRFLILEHVLGRTLRGGKGSLPINIGISPFDKVNWQRQVVDKMGNGYRMGEKSCYAYLCGISAPIPTMCDIEGRWHYEDFAGKVPEYSDSFKSMRYEPMFQGQSMLNEVFKFNMRKPLVAEKNRSFANTAMNQRQNTICCQTNVLVYDPLKNGLEDETQSYHQWGRQGHNCATIESGGNVIHVSDAIAGSGYQLFDRN